MKAISLIGLIFLLAGCGSQPAVQEETQEEMQNEINEIIEDIAYIAFDFDTDQSAAPFRDYGAAYIINVSSKTISIPISTWGNSTMFSHFYYDERSLRPVFTEMMLSRINRSNFLVLEPGARVLAFSVAFFHENLEQYPDALYDMRIFIDGEQLDVRGTIGR